MLVLSRREEETILLPSLGITIEVTRVQGKTVRLGIDAPNEIRIVRGELDQLEPDATVSSSPLPTADQTQIRRCLDAANLAIHLASNQLKQELNDHAETALENALLCLEELELATVGHCETRAPTVAGSIAVRESGTKYRVAAIPTCPTAAIITNQEGLRCRLASLLSENGFRVVEFSEETSLLKYIQTFEQPAVVLAQSTLRSTEELTKSINHGKDIELRISGVSGLRRNRISFLIDDPQPTTASGLASANTRFTGWFEDSEIALEIESLLQSA